MKRLIKKGVVTLAAVFCMASASHGMQKSKPSVPSVPITKEAPVSPLKKAFGIACIATSLFITYKIARLPTRKSRGPSDSD